jgi:hypothetical protein
MSTELAPTPIIDEATITAANLLRRVKTEILAEPKRLNLQNWVERFQSPPNPSWERVSRVPTCGSIGCIAGWCAILMRDPSATEETLYSTAESVMDSIVGGDELSDEVRVLFSDCVTKYDFPRARSMGQPGTARQAERVAARIENFLAAHPELETRVIQVR